MKLKIVNKSKFDNPSYKIKGSAGMDIRANLESPVTIKPLERVLIPTGIHIEIPEGCECQIRPRSGLALNHGITVVNTPGTVDAGYYNEFKIILINLSNEDFIVQDGERIAQLIFAKHETVEFENVDSIEEFIPSERNLSGFGSSGRK